MREYTVDFTRVKTLWDLHQALKDGLGFPSYYGMNMNALWDCLTSDIEHSSTIYLKGIDSMPKTLAGQIRVMLETFDEAIDWYANINLSINVITID